MVQSPEEKRMAPRHSYTFPVTYTGKVGTPAMPPQEVLFQGKIVDLSSGGATEVSAGDPLLQLVALLLDWLPTTPVPGDGALSARVLVVGEDVDVAPVADGLVL